jgi:hypothetical protein
MTSAAMLRVIYAEFHMTALYAECHYAEQLMLSVILLIVVAPLNLSKNRNKKNAMENSKKLFSF